MARGLLNRTDLAPEDLDNYPDGRTKNSSPPAAKNGTRGNEELFGDLIQLFLKWLRDAGIDPNGLPDNVSNGYQLEQALISLINKQSLLTFDFLEPPGTPASDEWHDVVFGNGVFVAILENAPDTTGVIRSADGRNWTEHTVGTTNIWDTIIFGDGVFAMCARDNSGTAGRFRTSPDGITWTARNPTVASLWNAGAYGDGVLLFGSSTGGLTQRSTDGGVTWVAGGVMVGISTISDIAFGNGTFVGVENSDLDTNTISTSSNGGVSWTARTAAAARTWFSVAFGPINGGRFVAVASGGTDPCMYSDDNGVTWTVAPNLPDQQWTRIRYINGLFIAAAADGANQFYKSTNGIDWVPIEQTTPVQQWRGIAGGNGKVVITSSSGGADKIAVAG